MFFKKQVYTSYSLIEISKIRDALSINGINYSYKVKDLTTDWSGSSLRNDFGSLGSNSNFEKQYVISVSHKDVEQAEYLIHLALNT